MRDPIASELVGYQSVRCTLLPFEKFTEKAPGGSAITPSLQQYVDDVAVLVNGTPQIVALRLYIHEHLIQEPVVA